MSLLDQLERYYTDIDDQQDPIRGDEIVHLVSRVRELPIKLEPQRPGSRFTLAVAVALGIVAIAVGTALLVRGGVPASQDVAGETYPPVSWSVVADFNPASITTGGPGFVAVGGVPDSTDKRIAAVWVSVDGRTWSRVAHDPTVFEGETDHEMGTVTAAGPGLVAIGEADGRPAVWMSENGFTWTRPAVNDVFVIGDTVLNVVAGGPGLVAVGQGYDERPAIWTSEDGIKWSRVAPPSGYVDSDTRLWDVAAGESTLVAVGGSVGDPGFWISQDGLVWKRVSADPAVFGDNSWVVGITSWGSGLVAVGLDGPSAAVWTSTDGTSWVRAEDPIGVFGPGTELRDVAAGADGLVAVGFAWRDGPASVRAVWTSGDGVRWSRVGDPALDQESEESSSLWTVTIDATTVVTGGSEVWLGQPVE